MNFNFGEVLTRAWQHVWKHKVLWVFGILASCARGNGGGGGNNSGSRYQTSGDDLPFSGGEIEQTFTRFGQYLEDNLWIIAVFIVAIFLLSLIFFTIGMMGRAGLIKGTYQAEMGAESLQFGELWSESMRFFGRIFGLNFLFSFLSFVIALVIFVPLIFLGVATAGVGLLCLLPLICLLIPIAIAISIVIEQAQAAIVIEDLGVMDGLKRGWEIARSNIGPVIVMALILGIGGGIVGTIISLPLILAVVPIVIGAGSLSESLTPVYIALACCLVYFPVLLFFNGILSAYIQSAWTLTYMRLTAKPKEEAPVFVEADA